MATFNQHQRRDQFSCLLLVEEESGQQAAGLGGEKSWVFMLGWF